MPAHAASRETAMLRYLRLLLIIEAVVILACCPCAAMTVSALFVKLEFLSTYRAICSTALAGSVLLLGTLIFEGICLRQNNPRYRIVRVFGAIVLFVLTLSLTGWIFSPTIEAKIKQSAYLSIWSWVGVIPVVLASIMFFKLPEQNKASKAEQEASVP